MNSSFNSVHNVVSILLIKTNIHLQNYQSICIVDFSLSQWKAEKMLSSMGNYSIALLVEELGLFGYLNSENQTCDKSGTISALSWWTNSTGKYKF